MQTKPGSHRVSCGSIYTVQPDSAANPTERIARASGVNFTSQESQTHVEAGTCGLPSAAPSSSCAPVKGQQQTEQLAADPVRGSNPRNGCHPAESASGSSCSSLQQWCESAESVLGASLDDIQDGAGEAASAQTTSLGRGQPGPSDGLLELPHGAAAAPESRWQTTSLGRGHPGPSDVVLELLHEAAAAPESGWQATSRGKGQPGPSDGLLELLHEAAAAPAVRLADLQPEPGAPRTI